MCLKSLPDGVFKLFFAGDHPRAVVFFRNLDRLMAEQDRYVCYRHSLEQEFDSESVPPPMRVPVFDLGQLIQCFEGPLIVADAGLRLPVPRPEIIMPSLDGSQGSQGVRV